MFNNDGLVKSRKLDFLPKDVGYKIEKAIISCGRNKMLGLFTSASTIRAGHMIKKRNKKILIAKPGLDGHDRGAKVVARALRDAGMEVIYSGLHQTPLQIANTAIDEDVDAVGLSILSGAHNTVFAKLTAFLREKGVRNMVVFGGGTIPKKDWDGLRSMGVAKIFTPGSDTNKIVDYLNRVLEEK